LILFISSYCYAQRNSPIKQDPAFTMAAKYFDEIVLKADTNSFDIYQNRIRYKEQDYLAFQYNKEDEECEVSLTPKTLIGIAHLQFMGSGDFSIIDSLVYVNDNTYRGKIKFNNLTKSNFTSLRFAFLDVVTKELKTLELPIFLHTNTIVRFYPNHC